jgi:uncharacterized membrane protein YccC
VTGRSTTGRVFLDPARVNLRKAARATLVVPTVFAVLFAVGDTSAALFGAFGSFAALVFANFGGALPWRFAAYLRLMVVSALLIAVGTAVADTLYPAVLVTLVVAFVVSFFGALGGYFAAGATAATLAFVLSVMSPEVQADLWARELGFVVGVLASAVAAVTLWPVHQRDRVRAGAGTVLKEVAAYLGAPAATRDLSTARDAAAALDERVGVVYRPAGSVTREQALAGLVIAVRRLVPLLDAITAAERSSAADTLPAYAALSARTALTFGASARVLAGEPDAVVDLDALDAARTTHTDALDRWAAEALDGDEAARVVDRFGAAFPLRRLSFAAAVIGRDASLAAHDRVRSLRQGAAAFARARAVLRAHSNVRSVRFRNAARAGLGLAFAVFVAKTASIEHAFWVVLGALAVLRSNALGTGATALQALVGALVGFGVASALMETVGADDTVLWILLPFIVFLAAYTPGAVNFVVGQAFFTVFVVVLFNVLQPDGWRTGLVRVQDVAIGAAISVVVGALLWPRGARGVARRAFAELLRAGRARLTVTLERALHRDADVETHAAATDFADARTRAVAALEDLALEHGGGQVAHQAWGGLLADATVLEIASEGIGRAVTTHGRVRGCPDALAALEEEGRAVAAAVDAEADRVERSGVGASAASTGAAVEARVPPALFACLEARASDGLPAAIGLLWVHEWLALLGDRPRCATPGRGPDGQRYWPVCTRSI